MGVVKLELRSPNIFNGIASDPEPDWSLESLVSELSALELTLKASSPGPRSLTKVKSRGFSNGKERGGKCAGFVMRVSEDEMEDIENTGEECQGQGLVKSGARFSCRELDFSDSESSEDDFDFETPENYLMDKPGVAEGILFESKRESQLRIEEEIRNRFSALEAELRSECERSASALNQVEKYISARRETYRRQDKQYQRRIAEELDNHLSAVQRDHEQLSLIEERKIRDDAALEEAKRKDKALYEEKMRQEKAKAEAEARFKASKAAEEAQRAALEAERRAVKKVAEQQAAETQTKVKEEIGKSKELGSAASAGINVKASETALKLAEERLAVHKKFVEMNSTMSSSSNNGFLSYERQIARRVKQISGTQENFRAKASDLVKIINDPNCPQSISIAMFAKQVVSLCENPSVSLASTAYACGRVIVLVTSQFPVAMDLVLAEFHKACIYTVPKHIRYSESAFPSKEAYFKMVGYQEEDGKIDSSERYVERVEAYMTLYAALVQTDINGIKNLHGLKEGWAWLARFLNTLPADSLTAVALLTFLKVAGFALFRKYKSQFKKLLDVISREFLAALKSVGGPQLNPVITGLETYIGSNEFLQEPKGWQLQTNLLSKIN